LPFEEDAISGDDIPALRHSFTSPGKVESSKNDVQILEKQRTELSPTDKG
jgi:hypothetical protein